MVLWISIVEIVAVGRTESCQLAQMCVKAIMAFCNENLKSNL